MVYVKKIRNLILISNTKYQKVNLFDNMNQLMTYLHYLWLILNYNVL